MKYGAIEHVPDVGGGFPHKRKKPRVVRDLFVVANR